ncbi:hypothetical protein LTR85_008160 [Meristemomyces frigidus]|nr:hypothetical protein LTR85_008160 [Meristemomyces frigidus]
MDFLHYAYGAYKSGGVRTKAPAQVKAPREEPIALSSDSDVIFVKSVEKPSSKKRPLELTDDEHQAPQPKKQRPTKKECIICCEERSNSHFPALCDGPECAHEVCSRCWRKHLAAETESKAWNDIKCPECTKVLQDAEIEVLASEKTYMIWLDKAAKSCTEANEEFRSCPSATCNWGCFLSTREDGNIFNCQKCQFKYCIICEVRMHDGETCATYQKRLKTQDRGKVDQLSAKAIKKISKPCPKCGVSINKISGCDHITCSRTTCKHEWCWRCFASYGGANGIHRQGNGSHERTCKYHTSRLRA